MIEKVKVEIECGICGEIYKINEDIKILEEYKVSGLHLKDFECRSCKEKRTISNWVSGE